MVAYRNTIAKKYREYLNKTFLLADCGRKKLLDKDGTYLETTFDKRGELSFRKINSNLREDPLDNYSLRKIGVEFLALKDPSVPQMLKYLVLPEMEVERIFNSLRYKYLKAIYDSKKLSKPYRLLDAGCNKAFQSMAGITVYQGNTKDRKKNDDFWREWEFHPRVKKLGWEEERNALGFILSYIRHMGKENIKNINKAYAELIAIKPGFHEMWIHDDYFDYYSEKHSSRDRVFRGLQRNLKLPDLKVKKFPAEINKGSYLSYAPCNVTEGPFVYRKSVSISYYDEIIKVRSRDQLSDMYNSFYILDYYPPDNMVRSRSDLNALLEKAEKFTYFM